MVLRLRNSRAAIGRTGRGALAPYRSLAVSYLSASEYDERP